MLTRAPNVKIILEPEEIEVPVIYIACEGSGHKFLAVVGSVGYGGLGGQVN